jgi:coenzyme F420-dependent glucose-6-phosphate dehydrogenase
MSLEIHYNVFGCFREPEADVELAQDAVDAGFEGIWIGDHFMPWIDSRPYTHHTWTWLAALVTAVPDVPVGTSVTCPMLRYRPPLLAQMVATLDRLSSDRVHLGVGTGEALNEAHFVDEWADWETRADMMVETIDLLRTLWEGDYVDWDGEYFDYEGIKLYTPPEAEVSIHWAGWGPRSCRRAGRHADNLLTAASPEAIAGRIRPNFEQGLAEAGRDPEGVDVTTEVAANVGDPDALVAELRERGEHVPVEEIDNPDPREIQTAADEALAEMSDAEIREAGNITDDPAELIETLERYEEAGATRVLVGSTCGDPRRTIEAFEAEIIPHFD